MVSRKDHKDNKTGLKSRNQIGGGAYSFFRTIQLILDRCLTSQTNLWGEGAMETWGYRWATVV